MTNILSMPALLARNVSAHGDAVAFIDGERRITYREFDTMVGRTAAWLAEQGVSQGDTVAVWLVNRMEWMAMYFGLAHLGAAMMTVNTRYRSHELEYILERSKPRLLVLQLNFRKIDFPEVLRDANPAAGASLERVVVVDAEAGLPAEVLSKPTVAFDLASLPDRNVPVTGGPDAPSILFTTSGTTSGPKLVLHLQRTLAMHAQRVAVAHGMVDEGVTLLATLPFCGVFGFAAALGAFAAGRPVVLMDTFDGKEAADLIRQHKVTHVYGSDEMYRRIFEHAPGERPFPSARVFGFAAFHPGTVEFGQEAWKRGIPMLGLYGSSEVLALFSIQKLDQPLADRLEGGGTPVSPDAQIRIRDVETGALLPPGRSGAIEIKAPTNFIGYLNNPEATAKAVDEEGFFRTGDVGYLREDGSFVYQTRQGDAIRLGGYLVSPVEIEDVLKSCPGVADVQVVSVEIDGQPRAVAFAIPCSGERLDRATMISIAKQTMAPFKVPARIWEVAEFPTTRSANGTKIQRARLREMAIEWLAQEA